MKKTLGEIAKSHGFDSLSDYENHINKLTDEIKRDSFNVGETVQLKPDYKPTHFKEEEILSLDTDYIITEKSTFTLDSYYIKLEGYDVWFKASVFKR